MAPGSACSRLAAGGATIRGMDRDAFCESLLRVMEAKQHWAWPAFGRGEVPKRLLHVHLEQEYETYVRDFPIYIGRTYVQCPLPEVRRALAENLYEEETGGLVAGRPHPELFMEYPRGLGMDLQRFEHITPLPAARRYRDFLLDASGNRGWAVGAAVTTIFVEGTPYERGEVDTAAPRRPEAPLELHPLVVHYGLPLEALALTKAHRKVEGHHRRSAWDVVLDHVVASERAGVVDAMTDALAHWQAYRDDVAAACGLAKPPVA